MKRRRLLWLVVGLTLSIGLLPAQQAYNVRTPLDPATQPMAEEMRGETLRFTLAESQLYPGTEREVQVYVPALYDGSKPACLLVCLDGVLYDAKTVMDNLIATGEMPVTIGVFIQPGVVKDEAGEVVRYNRCKEFDSTDDRLALFIEQEVLARVEGMVTDSGKHIRLSNDANDRCITGASSGGIAAFSVAWHRPDLYSRVYTTVGTFVAMRGGHTYPAIIRKTEPKPLRIYMQDGWYDVWNPIFGEWFEYNLLMESALNFAGYEAYHKWDRGNHSIKYGTLAFPDAMRWLWRGYPTRVEKGQSDNGMLQEILSADSDWQEMDIPTGAEQLFATQDGGALLRAGAYVYKVSDEGKVKPTDTLKAGERWLGEELTARGNALYHHGKKVADGLYGLEAAQALEGGQYIALCDPRAKSKPNVWVVNAGCGAIAIAPDYRMCVTHEAHTHHLIASIIDQSGTIRHSEPFYYLHDMSNGTLYPSGTMAFDTKGNLYVATQMGVQVADHNGRVRAILSLPAGRVDALAFSGKKLYVLCGERLFVRTMQAEGHNPAAGRRTYASQGQG